MIVALGVIIAAMAAQDASDYRSPEGKAAAVSYARALSCAIDFAEIASFDRVSIEAISREAVEHCSSERDDAAKRLRLAIKNADDDIANENISAKMRIAADDKLIARLESGDAVIKSNADNYGLNKPAVRYATCIRVALNRKLEGLHLGDTWLLGFKGSTEAAVTGAFVEIGHLSCSNSQANYTRSFDQVIANARGDEKETLENSYKVTKIEEIAFRSYIRLALEL